MREYRWKAFDLPKVKNESEMAIFFDTSDLLLSAETDVFSIEKDISTRKELKFHADGKTIGHLENLIVGCAGGVMKAAPVHEISYSPFLDACYIPEINPHYLDNPIKWLSGQGTNGVTSPCLVTLGGQMFTPFCYNEQRLGELDIVTYNWRNRNPNWIQKIVVVVPPAAKDQLSMDLLRQRIYQFEKQQLRAVRDKDCPYYLETHRYFFTLKTLFQLKIGFFIAPMNIGDAIIIQPGCARFTFSCTVNQSIGTCYYSKSYDTILTQLEDCNQMGRLCNSLHGNIIRYNVFEFTLAITRRSKHDKLDQYQSPGTKSVSESESVAPSEQASDIEDDPGTATNETSVTCSDEGSIVVNLEDGQSSYHNVVPIEEDLEKDLTQEPIFEGSATSIVSSKKSTLEITETRYSDGTQVVTKRSEEENLIFGANVQAEQVPVKKRRKKAKTNKLKSKMQKTKEKKNRKKKKMEQSLALAIQSSDQVASARSLPTYTSNWSPWSTLETTLDFSNINPFDTTYCNPHRPLFQVPYRYPTPQEPWITPRMITQRGFRYPIQQSFRQTGNPFLSAGYGVNYGAASQRYKLIITILANQTKETTIKKNGVVVFAFVSINGLLQTRVQINYISILENMNFIVSFDSISSI
ncbi:unnamed protein product, partial [Allacma fusca]